MFDNRMIKKQMLLLLIYFNSKKKELSCEELIDVELT